MGIENRGNIIKTRTADQSQYDASVAKTRKSVEMDSYRQKEKKEREDRAAYIRRTEELCAIINPLRTAQYEVDHDWRYIRTALDGYRKDYGGMDLTPDFQRGHVWTPEQQCHFIENVLRGVVSSAGFVIQFNCPNWENDRYSGDLPRGFQCIDGLQRLTAVQSFLDGDVKPFGLSADDLNGSRFSMRGSSYRFRMAVHDFQTRADLLQHYVDLNAGGTPHTKAEIDRVRELRNAATLN